MDIRYVTDPNGNGWVLAVPDGVSPAAVQSNPGLGFSLPWCLKVELLRTEGGREYFQILEGAMIGKKASLKLKSASESYLTRTNLHRESGVVKLKKTTQQLWYGSSGPFNGFTETSNPVPTGNFDLEIPDAPHVNYYPTYSKYQQVWFRIGHSGDRYLHLGTISHGCATVRPFIPNPATDSRFAHRTNSELGLPAKNEPFANWDQICGYLMGARKGDDKSVGKIIVLD
jgi:hypothetical protein